MTTTSKVDFSQRLKLKIQEVNALIKESNAELAEGETRLAIKIGHSEWHPMANADSVRGMNKYINCTISENISY